MALRRARFLSLLFATIHVWDDTTHFSSARR